MAPAGTMFRMKATLAAGAALPDLLPRLDRWLRGQRPNYAQGLRPGASPDQLRALHGALGQEVPPDLQTLLAWHDGQTADFVGCFENNWQLMGTEQIAAALTDLTAGGAWRQSWIPFLDDDAGDYVFLDTSAAPAPVREFWLGKQPVTVAASIVEWLERFVTAVERGQYVEDPERGAFVRRTHS
jgi:cell wall assembly regulator SMI1